MDPLTLALILAGSAALASSGRGGRRGWGGSTAVRGGGSSQPKSSGKITKSSRANMMGEIKSMSIWYSNKFGSMPNLYKYLTAIGYIESNFNPRAANKEISSNPGNAARGLFGMRPKTAFQPKNGLEPMRAYPNALLSPKWSFVCATYYVWNACGNSQRDAGRTANFAAVRRFWGYPSLLTDYSLNKERSVSSLRKFKNGISGVNQYYGAGIDMGFIYKPILGWRNYPGMGSMLKSFGLRK